MKFAYLLLGLVAAGTSVHGCITAHAYYQACILDGVDTVSTQVWSDGFKECGGGASKSFSSDETVFFQDCGKGNKVYQWDELHNLKYHKVDGYEITLHPRDFKKVDYVCGNLGDEGEIHGTQIEASYWSDDCPGKCRLPHLCDGRSFCPGFDAACY